MFLHEVTIDRPTSYGGEPQRPLRGKVVLEGSLGKIEVILSPSAIGRITACIAGEVHQTARRSAKDVEKAMDAASNETALLGQLPVEGDDDDLPF